MGQVETIQFALVVWHDITSIFESVVSSAVFNWISFNAARQGRGIFGSMVRSLILDWGDKDGYSSSFDLHIVTEAGVRAIVELSS